MVRCDAICYGCAACIYDSFVNSIVCVLLKPGSSSISRFRCLCRYLIMECDVCVYCACSKAEQMAELRSELAEARSHGHSPSSKAG